MPASSERPYYHATGVELEVFRTVQKAKLPLLLKGPTGCGKSRFVEAMAFESDRALIQVNCNEDTSASDLLGRYLLKGGDTIWQDGPVTRAVRLGAILYLDEIAEAREDVTVLLHSLTDHRRQLYLDRLNETLHAPDTFQIIVSFNPGYQSQFKSLKPSTRQRFVTLAFGFPTEEAEIEIVQKESGIDTKVAKHLVSLATKIRNLSELQLKETASTRLLVNTAKMIQLSDLGPRAACEAGIVQCLADDPETAQTLTDIVALYF